MDYNEVVYHLVMKESMRQANSAAENAELKKNANSFENNTNGAKAPQSPSAKGDLKERFNLKLILEDMV